MNVITATLHADESDDDDGEQPLTLRIGKNPYTHDDETLPSGCDSLLAPAVFDTHDDDDWDSLDAHAVEEFVTTRGPLMLGIVTLEKQQLTGWYVAEVSYSSMLDETLFRTQPAA
jgi:hypothetical protein